MSDSATSVLNEISGALDGLATQVVNTVNDDRSFMELWGWNLPAINCYEFADRIRSSRPIVNNIDVSSISDVDVERLRRIPGRIQYILGNSLPNLPGSSALSVYVVIDGLIDSIESILFPYQAPSLNLQAIEDRKLLPASQIRVLRRTADAISRLDAEQGDLAEKVEAIRSAHRVAEELPADIQSLADAKSQYAGAQSELLRLTDRAKSSLDEINEVKLNLVGSEEEARAVIQRANSAYSAATTIGLGAAFAERASKLHFSTLVLGVVLLITLGAGALITYLRVEFVHELMRNPRVNYNVLWLNVTFTALSVSAPVWLAWLLTRQIGQRFRLAEDYGYKAAVAKAYEGYRAEAAQIDAELTKKLFGIALERLGEAPLRLVEKDSPGSPVHEAQGPIRRLLDRRNSTREIVQAVPSEIVGG